MTINEAVQQARARLEQAGLDAGDAAFDADVLARHALGRWDRGQLIVHLRSEAPAGFVAAYEALVARRAAREPAAYIMGCREFWGLEFDVTPAVLVPRPETELIVEEVLDRSPAPGPRPLLAADIGTGSGCLAVALARGLPEARVIATDLSDVALDVARGNVRRHGVEDRVTLVRADLFSCEVPTAHSRLRSDGPGAAGRESARREERGRAISATPSRIPNPESRVPIEFDVIVSNPPYVPGGEIASLQPEVRDYEPRGALDGGPDGLDVVRRLVPESAGRLTPGGLLVFEFGYGQASGVREIVGAEPRLDLVTIRSDYAGIPRVAIARRAAVN